MMPLRDGAWRVDLEQAASDGEVLQLARRYLETITDEEMGSLPRACRPGPIETCGQISECALRLVRESLHTGRVDDDVALLSDMSQFFAAASAKIAALHARDRR